MSKVKIVIAVVAVTLVTNGVQGVVWAKLSGRLNAEYTKQIEVLQESIDTIGPRVECYSVLGDVYPGKEIKEEDIKTMMIPSSFIGENYIRTKDELLGKYYKIKVTPGTPISSEMIMEEKLEDSTRDVDIVVNRWTVGLRVGDYVDYRITLPYGDDYIVLSHLRIQSIGNNTLKVYLTEEQWHKYQGSLVDYYLNSEHGAAIYVQKYIEPGVQAKAVEYYAVPENIEAIMLLDPNILDKAAATANKSLRKSIDKIMDAFEDEDKTAFDDGGKLGSGRGDFNGKINSDGSVFAEESKESEYSEEVFQEEVFTEEVFTEEEVVQDGEVVE